MTDFMAIKSMYTLRIILLGVFLTGYYHPMAQIAQEKYGRNRIQTNTFDWRFLSSANFDVYFYQGSEKIAREINEFLEAEFDRITDMIGYPPYFKTKIFLYNSVSDLQQSNVGIDEGTLVPGGETQFVKPYIEVANPGTVAGLKVELLTKVSELMVDEMMFGGSLKDMFQSAVLLNLPEWFIAGAVLYVAKGWSMEMDDFARELVSTRSPGKFNRLTGNEAALAGQSLWNFIAHKYGKSNISNILNYTRIIRNEEKSLTVTLGMSFEQLMLEWQNFYLESDRQVSQNYIDPLKEHAISGKKNRKRVVHHSVKINPDASKIAYTENNNGRYAVVVKELDTKKESVVLRGGYRVIAQQVEYDLPVVDWADKSLLGIVHAKKGEMVLTLADMNTGNKTSRVLRKLDQVKNLEFSSNGRLAVMSAVANGRNDLYLVSTRRNRIKRLTNDIFDDIDPSFVPGTNTIVFSSNRVSDTLDVKEKNIEGVSTNFNLFFFDLDTTKNVLHRITNTISRDVKPIASDANRIFYQSDQRGINNIFSYDIASGIYSQVTNYSRSIDRYDINFEQSSLAFIAADKGRDFVYYRADFDYNRQIFTPQTLRRQILQIKELNVRREAQKEEGLTIEQIVKQRLQNKDQRRQDGQLQQETTPAEVVKDSTLQEGEIDTDNYSFDIPSKEKTETEQTAKEEDIIDTDNYLFDADLPGGKKPASAIAQYRKARPESRIDGPFPYQTRFSIDNLLTSFVIDPLRGFGILLEVELNDMLENHKFSGGGMAVSNLESGDIFVKYQYLEQFIDFDARFDRNVILWQNDINLQQYSKNSIELGASIPLNTKSRLSLKPFLMNTVFENLLPRSGVPPSFLPIEREYYMGATAEVIFDNSIIIGTNTIIGSRMKMRWRHYEAMEDNNRSFSHFFADLRHYQKIHRELVFAVRGYVGSFFGNAPKQYLLGGMDNWIGRQINTEGNGNPLQDNNERTNADLLFVQYATPLRGFDYATFYGNNVMTFNAELRMPLVRYLVNAPISSNFLRNFQLTGFFDIGSAWTGKWPFSNENRISNQTISESGFVIDLRNFRTPWLYSYGIGLRTVLLGYYMKLDVAWPVENFVVKEPRISWTLGFDF